MEYSKPVQGVKKPVRSVSGVTPLTVVLKPRKCNHGTCIYCPGGEKVPQSYTEKSPAVMRALRLGFDPHEQVKIRLNTLKLMNHPTEKIEIIILGGTFLQYSSKYQKDFIKKCFDALNGNISKDLESAKKLNEESEHRCVALCIENRPDNCSKEEIERMLSYGCTRVELGVQMPDDEIYKRTNRGHMVKDVITATEKLKDAGFKVGYHVMIGLPFSNPEMDMRLFNELFNSEEFRPDQLKIYPCQVMKDSPLEKTYKLLKFKPYTDEQAKNLIKEMMKVIPEYCRVMRIVREFPRETMVEGLERLGLRKDIENELRKEKQKINEIRMREIGFNKNVNSNVRLKITKYGASKGKEFFLQFVNKDNILFGLLRLRIFKDEKGKKQAMVREIHVYGQALNLKDRNKYSSQHKGIGKLLLNEAEKITRENGIKKLSVISGVGVREYYRNLGYRIKGYYMVKKVQNISGRKDRSLFFRVQPKLDK
ncbi:tRNA uridine(34) 5-carboxymethylaminomethyl modification radical SAM/GNAT enzyme Elp3 [Candidatus Pacearchaeota archaeon CG10_big_fil_rev_8_21_14_0_10_34_12]|nr:MAG: tRNA uridine(34) 5-carboxymethylaminomethyl modification radical SAM/GNAT enzyme Elp3 [Candidatus Pacearchaeota archaeon CG10_big_fil_rev_8_21_14_0_10_34_12]